MFEKLRSQFEDFFDKISRTELKGESLEKVLDELEISLVENDVAVSVSEYICQQIREKAEAQTMPRFSDARGPLRDLMRQVLMHVLTPKAGKDVLEVIESKKALGEPAVILLVGINGNGKTTTLAKLGYFLKGKGYGVVLACGDTYRSGSIEQLQEHADRIGVKTIKQTYGADAAAVAFDAVNYARSHGVNAVLIDTAGRMQTNKNLLDEMRKIARVTKPDLVILVVDALTGNDAYEQGRTFMDAVNLDGIILTKLDADAKGGSAVSMSYVTGRPVLFVGTGQRYEDLKPFDPQLILDQLFK